MPDDPPEADTAVAVTWAAGTGVRISVTVVDAGMVVAVLMVGSVVAVTSVAVTYPLRVTVLLPPPLAAVSMTV